MNRLVSACLCLLMFTGCESKSNKDPATPAAPTAPVIGKIVFVGQEEACKCTRERIKASWAALEGVLGTEPSVPVERLQLDTQAEKVDEYRKKKPFTVAPAIYFLDERGQVVAMLQGEVSPQQVKAALK